MYDKSDYVDYGGSISVCGKPMLAGQGVGSNKSTGFAGTLGIDVMSEDFSSTATYPSDTMDKTGQKGDGIMSFVGMYLCEDRIVAFGDSKSSRIFELGGFKEQQGRGEICKVFSNENYVLATHSTNQFLRKEVPFSQPINIEDWLAVNVPIHNDYVRLLEDLSGTIIDKSVTKDNPIGFIIGSREHDRLFVQGASVYEDSVLLEKRAVDRKVYIWSVPFYRAKETEINRFMENDDADIKDIIEKCIRDGDALGGYNPAGCPVNVITWPDDVS